MLYTPGDVKNHAAVGKLLNELPERKNGYVIIVKENRPVRSLSANGYYWVILDIIAIHTGHAREFLHEEMKRKFNSVPVEGFFRVLAHFLKLSAICIDFLND